MSDTGGFPLVGGSPAFPGKNNVVRDGSGSNSFGWENLNVGNLSIVGGYRNKVTSSYSYAFGISNAATGRNAFSFGESNTSSGRGSLSIGTSNTASGAYSFCSGQSNTASGNHSVAFGAGVTASGNWSLCSGVNGSASSSASFVCGISASATRYAEFSHGAGNLGLGICQHGWLIFANQSTSVTPVVLYLDGTGVSQRAVLAAGARWKCTLEIIATTTGAIDKSASWEYKFQIDRPTTAATTIIRTTPLLTLSDGSNTGAPPAGWSVAITADTTNGCPQIQVTGDTDTINWTAALHYVQTIRV